MNLMKMIQVLKVMKLQQKHGNSQSNTKGGTSTQQRNMVRMARTTQTPKDTTSDKPTRHLKPTSKA